MTTKKWDVCCIQSRKSTIGLLSLFILANCLASSLVVAELTAVVRTTNGPVQGEILNSVNSVPYAAFKGMPFGEPPIGHLRFKPPVPVKPWTKVRNATVEGEPCAQVNLFTRVFSGSEDCLSINVYTPVTNLSTPSTNLTPVLAWIHGGGFSMGSSSTISFRPDYILEKGVIFVSFNYRVGAFGFLSLIHPNATGNAGLKDQVLGLKWVRDNIKKFGGNPNNVTIMGESAGSASVGYLVLSDAAAGLFHGAISMSGVPLNPWAFQTPAVARVQGEKLGALLGTVSTNTDTLLKAFYKASAFELADATANTAFMGLIPFAPTLEDKKIATDLFLGTCSLVKYITGNYSHVPQILGFMDRETISIAAAVRPLLDVLSDTLSAVDAFGETLPGCISIVQDAINKTTSAVASLPDDVLEALIDETTSILFVAGIDLTQKLLAATNKEPVFYYHFSYYPEGRPVAVNPQTNHSFYGAGHGDDLSYVFYVPAFNASTNPTDPTRRTIDRVSTMLTNFIKYGDPTPHWVPENGVNITWPDSGPSGRALDIGVELKIDPRPIDDFTKLVEVLTWPILGITNGCY